MKVHEGKMILFKVGLLFAICGAINGYSLMKVEDGNKKLRSFVESIIVDLNARNSITTGDVAMLRLGVNEKSKREVEDLYETVVRMICKENPLIVPNINEISSKGIKRAALIIMVTDGTSVVSFFNCKSNK